ncbi:hypothetical protein GCT13_08120 [Paraburkholderia sp. CNPSo 3157]|uniref:Uncharacterized protein n=1 Tax=Paraburkholderia franconis TaxID=2654983 RepID=A0A7X1N8D0_9BURK|nr:hypothetical protein [Paraburkholderia franconis]MPW16896.1 hypothetical protein [Paraburkholderia franconis]
MHTQNRVVQSSRLRRSRHQPVAESRTNRGAGSRWRAAAVTMSLGCAAASAHADYINDYVQAELGIGAAHYTTEDGRWYQQGMPGANNQLTSKPPAFSAGFTGPIISRGKWGMDWHAEYVNLGRASASCACTPRDENYNASTHQYTDKFSAPQAYFTGYGRSQGVALTIEPYYWIDGVRLGIEAGAYVHRDSWSEDIVGWQVSPAVAPQNLHVEDAYWSVAPLVGASVGNGRFTLSYRHYFMRVNSNQRAIPPLWNDADAIELKVKF